MSVRGFVNHVDLTVTDPQRSRPFYETVLGFMGYRCVAEHERGVDFDLTTPQGFASIGIMRSAGENASRPHDRYSPGLHHLAWTAESRDDVDRMHALLQSISATILDPPAEYPKYGPGYYAVFFADPDGLKLEYVYWPKP
ncbi:MAG: bleomycin resistance protein [Alphaproteobacteria bacterium]|nr:bleomycin resistance protein [Alphaproteobacteria bacterium]